jgi:hypothetical protein
MQVRKAKTLDPDFHRDDSRNFDSASTTTVVPMEIGTQRLRLKTRLKMNQPKHSSLLINKRFGLLVNNFRV